MEKKHLILTRYEYWSTTGKAWTKWFIYRSNPMTEYKANEAIEQIKNDFGYIDQKMKLKHEYMLKDYDEYQEEQATLLKQLEESRTKQAEYYKSAEYKELQKKKRQSAKERKERQKKYLEEHENRKS